MAAVTIIEDITRERIAELRDRFLARATETLMSSLDYEETLRNVAWLAVPEIADWCAVELVDERGERQRVAVAHRDPDKLDLAERLRAYEPEELDPDRGVGRILRTGSVRALPGHSRRGARRRRGQRRAPRPAPVARLPVGAARAAERARANVRRDDARDRGVDATLRGRRPRVRRAGRGTRRDRRRQRQARHVAPPDRRHAPAQPAPGRRPADRRVERRHALPSRPRRRGDRGRGRLLRLLRRATAAGSCCSATSPARASRPPR